MFVLHNKVGCLALYLCIGLRPYALGAGWQGGVAYELAHFIRRSPCLGTLLIPAPHSGATVLCGALPYESHRL